MKSAAVLLFLGVTAAHAGAIPGFRAQFIAPTLGFATSIAVDSHNTIYYTTQDGVVFRFGHGTSEVVTHVNTVSTGNSGLLGMALRDDNTGIVHYTTAGQIADIISSLDLTTGAETVVHTFWADPTAPGNPSSPEHHGGNPTIGPDGSIFFGIGDYGTYFMAPLPEWNGGKVFRIFPDGTVQQFARGFRNPFSVAWDDANQRLIVPDNGDAVDDEINIVHLGDFDGWPYTVGKNTQVDGSVAPAYVFPVVVAPTGILGVNGKNSYFPRGYLQAAFVAKAIFYIPDVDANPFPDPIPVIAGLTDPIISVTQAPNGDIFFVTGAAIYQLIVPLRGDCNGDGVVDTSDITALAAELAEGNPQPAIGAQNGAHAGSWGCDVNGDGVIDSQDMAALLAIVVHRSRVIHNR